MLSPLGHSGPDQSPQKLKIACIQFEPKFGEVEHNVTRSIDLIEQAAGYGARLIVLPELCSTGYIFQSREETLALSERVPEGPTTNAWVEAARRLEVTIVAGLVERDGNCLYNSAVIIDPSGVLGGSRKLHLWADEKLYFEPGDRGLPVFDTLVGRISVVICYDGWFPEMFRLSACQGAEIVCVPTNWVPMPEQPAGHPIMANILHMAAAHSNSIVIACADRVGIERGQRFLGNSVIINRSGWPVAGPCSESEEKILIGEVDMDPRCEPSWNSVNHPLTDRRTDVYGENLGADIQINLAKLEAER